MSFRASSFIFDGVSSDQYGLMIANLDSASQDTGKIGSKLSIQEDRIMRRHDALHYGISDNEPLSFPVAFVVNDGLKQLDRYDIATIAGWLSGHGQYKELQIFQSDMADVVFRCIITELELIEVAMRPVGFTATVTCDAPYAYRVAADQSITSTDTATFVYRNLSNLNDYYYPIIRCSGIGDSLTIRNSTDGSKFSLTGMGSTTKIITLDCLNQIFTSSDRTNLYACWNKVTPRFLRGDNILTIFGAGTITIESRFPWNIGY